MTDKIDLDTVDISDLADVLFFLDEAIHAIRSRVSGGNKDYFDTLPNELIELVGLREVAAELAKKFPRTSEAKPTDEKYLTDGYLDLSHLSDGDVILAPNRKLIDVPPKTISASEWAMLNGEKTRVGVTFDTIKRKIAVTAPDFALDIDIQDGRNWSQVRDMIMAAGGKFKA